MDIKREGVAKRKMIRRVMYLVILAAAVALAAWRVNQLKPAAPTVETATVWPDTVKRGPMVREVRGLGTLVPEDTLLLTASTDSTVKRILVKPGLPVQADTVIMIMSSPELETDLVAAEYAMKA